ncbi:MAG: hypothetical protein ABH821_05985 [archaeon]
MGSVKSFKWACVDTCFILGDFKLAARKFKISVIKQKKHKVEIKPNLRLRALLDNGAHLLITPITKYQVLENLVFSENIKFSAALKIYQSILGSYKNFDEINKLEGNTLTDSLTNKTLGILSKLNKKIELHDILNIEIARKAGVPIITSETKKIACWKKLYDKVLDQKQAWSYFKQKT